MVVFGINKNNGVSNKIDENFYKHSRYSQKYV